MHPKMPTRVRVGPLWYKVLCSERDTLAMRVGTAEDRWAVGYITYNEGTITIAHNCTPQQQRATLIHEVFHAVQAYVGIEVGKSYENESIARHMSYAWLDTLQRNPDLVAYLMSDDD